MDGFKQRWNRFWFAACDARNLGFSRAVIMLGAFLYYRSLNLEAWGFVRLSYWRVIPLFEHLHWVPLSPMAMWSLGFLWKTTLLLAGIGLFSRLSCAVAFGMGLYLLGLPNNVGKVDHNDAIVLWSFLILAIGRSGDAWSLDALIRAAKKETSPRALQRSGTVADPEYHWPLRLLQVLMALIFCISGTTKIRHAGFAWAYSDNLRNIFLMQQYGAHPLLAEVGVWIASHHYLCIALASFTLAMEVGAPLALFNRGAALFIIASLFSMQIGNELLLRINFRQFMLCYAVWVPWTAVGQALRRMLAGQSSAGKPAASILFDGSCGLCQSTMAVIRRVDLLQKTEILDAMNQWPTIATRFAGLTQDECLRTMHVVERDGRVTTGFYAYRTLAWLIPAGWLALPLLYVPGVPLVGTAIYDRIAAGRFRNGCGIDPPTAVAARG